MRRSGRAIFLGVAMESLLGDEEAMESLLGDKEVCSARLE
jgi:hypothetical protein